MMADALFSDATTHKIPLTGRQIRLMRLAGAASLSVALTLVLLKLWAWFATGSVALLGSLADSLLDLLASLITFVAVRYAVEPPDREHRFGHGKLEAVAGIVQAMIVSVSSVYVGVQAVLRLLNPEKIASPGVGAAVMGVSLLLTFGLITVQHYVVGKTRSLAIKADAVHYRADVLTNIAVLLAIYLNYSLDWYLADPLLGLIIVALILWSVKTIVTEATDVLLDRELSAEARASIRSIAAEHPAVLGVHDIRTRSSGAAQFIQFHLELESSISLSEAHGICDEVESAVHREFPRADVLIHADPFGLEESPPHWDR
jgi:ferrous-iron efflux pump FieF